jgi:cytochrome c-type biogenesis protein CcmE
MTRKQRRLTMIGGSLAVLAVAAALVLNAMRDSIVFFSTPAMVAEITQGAWRAAPSAPQADQSAPQADRAAPQANSGALQ